MSADHASDNAPVVGASSPVEARLLASARVADALAASTSTGRWSATLQAAAGRVSAAQPPDVARAVIDTARRLAAYRPDAAEHLLTACTGRLPIHREDIDALGMLVATLPSGMSRALCGQLERLLHVLTLAEVRELAEVLLRLPVDGRGGPPWPVVLDAAIAIVDETRLPVEARRALTHALLALAEVDPRAVPGEVRAAAQALATLDRDLHRPCAAMACRLARRDAAASRAWLREAPSALSAIVAEHRAALLAAAQAALDQHHDAPLALIQSSAALLQTTGRVAWETWLAAGRTLQGYAALAHYRRQSRRSAQALRAAQPILALGDVQPLLARYCTALAGQHIEVCAAADEDPVALRGCDDLAFEPRVVLPPTLVAGRRPPAPFVRYKVMATHQIAHIEFGTHTFALDRPARYFNTWRPTGAPGGLGAFFSLFPDLDLARVLFVTLEDARVDAAAQRQYRGLAADYCAVRRAERRDRPPIDLTQPRAALFELLVRLSLGGRRTGLPTAWTRLGDRVRRVLRVVERPGATVEDAAEATLRLYPLFAALPAARASMLTAQSLRRDELPPERAFLAQGPAAASGDRLDVAQPSYRSHQDAHLDQALLQARAADEAGGEPLTQEQLRELLERGLRDVDLVEGDEPSDSGLFVTDLLKKPPVRLRVRQAERSAGDRPVAQPRQRLAVRARRFVYDEWDFRAQDYRPDWCQLFERRMEEAAEDFVAATLSAYPDVAAAIRRHILHLRPHQLAKRRGLPEGEDLDLDAAIERVIALRSRRDPTDRVFWQRQRRERDVAVALLLDMSASTDAEVATAAGTRRIIDLAKESLALLSAALESVGDRYGIYGFSGYGRENVEYYVVKDLDEPYSAAIGRRIASIRPLRSTRMGPAIRHTTGKLQRSGALMRLLLLLSDGYPQDHDYYGIDRLERDYALHDTRMALLEARRRGIVPFCLTVDQAGYDYLRMMCDGLGYEVVRDLAALPERLGALYAQLTR
jgi:hypothetical protein